MMSSFRHFPIVRNDIQQSLHVSTRDSHIWPSSKSLIWVFTSLSSTPLTQQLNRRFNFASLGSTNDHNQHVYTCAYVWTTLQIFCYLQHTGFGSQIHPDPRSRSHFSHLNSGENNTCCLEVKGSGVQFLLLLFSPSVVSHPLRPHGLHYARIPVLHHLSEIAQSRVHWVGDTIQTSRPLSSPSLHAFNLFQHHSLC